MQSIGENDVNMGYTIADIRRIDHAVALINEIESIDDLDEVLGVVECCPSPFSGIHVVNEQYCGRGGEDNPISPESDVLLRISGMPDKLRWSFLNRCLYNLRGKFHHVLFCVDF